MKTIVSNTALKSTFSKTKPAKSASNPVNLSLVPLVGLAVCLGTGCTTSTTSTTTTNKGTKAAAGKPARPAPAKGGTPAIGYIGENPILSIIPGQEVIIPVHGSDLFQSSLAWSVNIGGTRNAIRGVDFDLETFADNSPNPSVSPANAEIILHSSYTSQLQDKDRLTIDVSIVDVEGERIHETIADIHDLENTVSNLLAGASATNLATASTNLNFKIAEIQSRVQAETPQLGTSLQSCLGRLAQPAAMSHDNLLSTLRELQDAREDLALAATRFPIVTSGTGAFEVYTVDSYRKKFQNHAFELFEIKAYPLPERMTTELLGPNVAKHFYVVALSLKNTSTQDRIINTGLINALGKALAYPANDSRPEYSIPVSVSPESLQQVYTSVAQSKWNTTREWIFRSLEFSGGMATAVATGFKGTPDLIRALSVFTGVGLPGLQTLWPDQVPNYLANIVNFGMPELVKVPQGASQGYQLLFFSKDNLDAMIPDPSQFRSRSNFSLNDHDKPLLPPKTYVVYLSFDTLVVPYDLSMQAGVTNSLAITASPQSVTALAGSQASFSVVAQGAGGLQYQWLYQGQAIARDDSTHVGTKTATLLLPKVTTSENGNYAVQILDSTGASITSAAASLTVTNAP